MTHFITISISVSNIKTFIYTYNTFSQTIDQNANLTYSWSYNDDDYNADVVRSEVEKFLASVTHYDYVDALYVKSELIERKRITK